MGKTPRTKTRTLGVKKETSSKDTSPYISQRDKLDYDFQVRELPWTEKQKELHKIILDKNVKCVFIEGPAGTSKTSTAVYAGLQLLKNQKVSDIVFVRSAVESADSKLGFLPGTQEDKFNVYMAPFNEKLEEFLAPSMVKKLHMEGRVSASPVNYLRGLHWAVKCIIVDECQNITFRELVTTITRIGEFSKIIFLGDPNQSDLPFNKSGGFQRIANLFSCEESKEHGIFHFKFTKEDIVRSKFVKFVVGKLEQENEKTIIPE